MSETAEILRRSRESRRTLLPEGDGFRVLTALGLPVPAWIEIAGVEELTSDLLATLPGERVVVKGLCRDLAHKSELQAVAVVSKRRDPVAAVGQAMAERLADSDFEGLLIQEWVDYDPGLGGELLVSLRWDREFGPVLTCAPGGIQAERLAADLRPERSTWIAAGGLGGGPLPAEGLQEMTVVGLMTRPSRGVEPRLPLTALTALLERLRAKGAPLLLQGVDEIEINPLVACGGRLLALDVLVRLSGERSTPIPDRPLDKLRCLLEPSSIAVVGVSRRANPGRTILRNLLGQGFDPARVHVVKAGESEIEGCRCVAELGDLPSPVDLLIVALAAAQVPPLMQQVVDTRCAESVIVISGGFEEAGAGAERNSRIRRSLNASRASRWRGPVVNGGNCMGVRSVPGGYDTYFLPQHKMPPMGGQEAVAALIAQSGAFLVARGSKLEGLSFRYEISLGNQIDLTLGDYLEVLSEDETLRVVGVYLEGFQDLDGLRSLATAVVMAERGQRLILYRAGRSPAGLAAAASHTAALAGSYRTTVSLARQAGILVAESLSDFEDLLELAVCWRDRPAGGRRVGGLSNAGFECVALSDRLAWFQAAELTPATEAGLRRTLETAGLDSLVRIRNPLDVTPMMGDELFASAAEAVIADPQVDLAVIGCVPLTGSLETLPPAGDHGEDLGRTGAVAGRLLELWRRTHKPWLVVVDAGARYDPFAERLRQGGIPTFRTMDRALQVAEHYLRG